MSSNFEFYGYWFIDVLFIEYIEFYLKKFGEDIIFCFYDFIYCNCCFCLRLEFIVLVVCVYLDNL